MASVKFNRGTIDQAGNNGADALGFLAKGSSGTPATAGDYGYLYLGTQMVATKYLKDLVVKGDFYTGSTPDQNDLIVSLSYNSGNPIVGAGKRFVTDSVVNPSSGTYSPADTDIMSALAVANYVSAQIGANDIYHKSGTSGTNSDGWNGWVYTADAYKGTTLLTSETDPLASAYELSFTLPVHSWTTTSAFASDETHLATPKQVADYIATMSGAMEYKGQLTPSMAASAPAAYKAGDTFIASEAISSIGAEAGDMVIVSAPIAQGAAFASSGTGANCNVFERNLDGALIKSTSNFTQYGVAYVENTTGTIASTAIGTSGQYLKSTGNGAPTWEDYVFYTIAAGSTANVLDITKYKNGNVDTSYGQSGTLSITINDVAHATNADKILQTVSTTDADVPLLIGQNNDSTANPAVTDSTPKDINYSALIKANASTGMITSKDLTVNTKTGSTYGNDTIDVAAALTWQTLS